MFRKTAFLICMFAMCVGTSFADTLPLNDALRATYAACVGIDDELLELKKMAGINTAVTAVGTASGTAATVVGIVKASKDSEAEELEKLIKELEELEKDKPEPTDAQIASFEREFNASYETAVQELAAAKAELDKLTKQSKTLGNWRTGLVAGATATNVAGAIIAGTNRVDVGLESQIDTCRLAVSQLRTSMMQARINGEDISEAQSIVSVCGEYDYVDIGPINKRATGALVSSVVGATTGVAGTVTSAIANTNKTRDDNSDSGKQKEKNLNTAANILSGTTAVASGVATVFNASQISAIKKVVSVAEKCTGVLR